MNLGRWRVPRGNEKGRAEDFFQKNDHGFMPAAIREEARQTTRQKNRRAAVETGAVSDAPSGALGK
jgi:hypothetical protein